MMSRETQRYTSVAIFLHWLIALFILGQIAGGLYVSDMPSGAEGRFALFQLHKSFGLTILGLTLLRILWRLVNPVPPLPEAMAMWEKILARLTHLAFYALMLAMPLSGWALVSSASRAVPTYFFGLFEVPHLPGLKGLENQREVAGQISEMHELLAFLTLGLLLLHIAAALKHHYFDRDDVLTRMLPFLKVRS
ncbi:MAG: cytochrome b [Alphaproteobacteria bacterium]|nr:cytochrome b [Alphaproteobacteria bacterium]